YPKESAATCLALSLSGRLFDTSATASPSMPFLLLRIRPPPSSTLFPYTTLFRSQAMERMQHGAGHPKSAPHPAASGIRQLHPDLDRKSTRLNSSHVKISYAVFCLKKKNNRRGFLTAQIEAAATDPAGLTVEMGRI